MAGQTLINRCGWSLQADRVPACCVQGKELIWNEFGVGGGISQVTCTACTAVRMHMVKCPGKQLLTWGQMAVSPSPWCAPERLLAGCVL